MKPSSMKPTKKMGKTETESSKGHPKIQHYFKTTPKAFMPEERCNVSDNRGYYIQALKDKLKNFNAEDENQSHTSQEDKSEDKSHASVLATGNNDSNDVKIFCDRCTIQENEAKNWEKKYKDLKQIYVKLSVRFSELDMKFNDLSKTVTSPVLSDTDTVVSTDGIFTLSELKILESIPLEKKKDSTFIMQCIEYAYSENPTILRGKTLKGVPESIDIKEDGTNEYHPGKDPLTPEKVKRIKELFIQRLSKCKTTSVDFGERVKESNINRLFSSGVKNVAKKQKETSNFLD